MHRTTLGRRKLSGPDINTVEIENAASVWYVYIMEYYIKIKKNAIMPFAVTWMDLEMIILSEVSQTEKDKYHTTSLTCGI